MIGGEAEISPIFPDPLSNPLSPEPRKRQRLRRRFGNFGLWTSDFPPCTLDFLEKMARDVLAGVSDVWLIYQIIQTVRLQTAGYGGTRGASARDVTARDSSACAGCQLSARVWRR